MSEASTGWGVGALVGKVTGSGLAGDVAGSVNVKKVNFSGRLDARLIEVETGEILVAFKDENETGNTSAKVAGGGGGVAVRRRAGQQGLRAAGGQDVGQDRQEDGGRQRGRGRLALPLHARPPPRRRAGRHACARDGAGRGAAPGAPIATLQLEGAGVPEGMAASATVLVPTEVRRARPDAQVISSEDVRSLLSHQKNRLVLGCGADAACLADLGGLLGVDEIVAGRLGRLGETFVLELRRLDVKQARNLASVTRAVGSAEALVGAVRSAAGELYATPPLPPRTAGGAAAGGAVATGGSPGGGAEPHGAQPQVRMPDDPSLPSPSLAKGEVDYVPLDYKGTRHRAVYDLVKRVIVGGGFPLEKERLDDDAALSLRTEWSSIERGRRIRFRARVDGRVALELDRQQCDPTGCRETESISRGEQKLAADVYAVIRVQLVDFW